ncbi:MAG: 30S ribosomal protein S8 [Verrucomicrobiota bacterium]
MQADPIADFLTQIRNANMADKTEVLTPYTRLKSDIANLLAREGFVQEAELTEIDGKQRLKVVMKTGQRIKPIRGLKKVSKPGRREYVGAKNLPRVLGGFGFAVISTSKGILTDQEARKENIGGEVLLHIW